MWSFDDYQSFLIEGRYDPGILKCIFMAGGPGSGKSYMANDLFAIPRTAQFSAFGLKVVNSDTVFETMLHSHGISPRDLGKMNDEDLIRYTGSDSENRRVSNTSMRDKAVSLTRKRYELFLQGKLGMLVDGTGNKFEKIARQKDEAESAGYDTFMVFVNTTLDVAQDRNAKRPRQLRASIVQDIWEKCQENLEAYSDMFGSDFLVVENNPDATDSELMGIIRKYIAQILRRPIQNPIGREWLDAVQ